MESRVTSETKENGAAKFDNNKPDYSLLPLKELEGMVRVLEFGAKKYDRDNWRKGHSPERLLAAALRHLGALQSGELTDSESGLYHSDHALCCLLFLSYNLKRNKEETKKSSARKAYLEEVTKLMERQQINYRE